MYAKTNPGTGRLTSRQKRIFLIVGVAFLALLGGLGAWGALASNGNSSSGHGCVNVTVPSSMGGADLHYCGAQARSFCQQAFRSQDQLSRLARPQCVLAGLAPAGTGASAGS
jgi:hypothetical protein